MKYFALSLCAAFFLFGCANQKSEKKPNVLIIFIDDMGYGDLSCYGNRFVRTPNIDKLAFRGTKFTNFYVNSPICSPSRTALVTGKYPMRFKIHSYIASSKQNRDRNMADYLDPTVNTLAKVLKSNGYATGHFGKWHFGGGRDLGDVPYPTEYGYDESLVSFEGIGDRILFPNDNLSEQSAKLGKGEITWVEKSNSTETYVNRAISFVRSVGDQPFFINLTPNDVHDPHLPDSLQLTEWTEITQNPYEQKFFAVLKEMDRQIGRLIDELEKSGKLSNTIILLTSDNGPTDWPFYYDRSRYPEGYEGDLYPPGFTGGLYGRKWSLYEGGIREPFIFYWEGHSRQNNTDSVSVISSFDLFPSICSMLEIKYPDDLDGTDKKEILLGNPSSEFPPLMWEYASNPGGSIAPGNLDFKSPNLAIRDGKWKLLVNVDGSGAKLYDLERDPGEKINLAFEQVALTQQLADKVISWRETLPVEATVN